MKKPDPLNDYKIDDVINILKNADMSSFDLERAIEMLGIINTRVIYWGVDHFRMQGMELCNHDKELYEKTYDESKFPDAIAIMILNYDSDWGINWQNVKEYLNNSCRKEEK